MYECLPPRRATSAREEEEQERTEPAITRQSLAERLPHEVQETEQPQVVDLDEEPEEEQAECPRGCGQRYPARLPGSCSFLPHVSITLLLSFSLSHLLSGKMRLHLQRKHKENVLKCAKRGCKFVSQKYVV